MLHIQIIFLLRSQVVIFREIFFLQLGIQWWYKPYLSFVIKFDHEKVEKHGNQSKFECGLDIYFPLKTKI